MPEAKLLTLAQETLATNCRKSSAALQGGDYRAARPGSPRFRCLRAIPPSNVEATGKERGSHREWARQARRYVPDQEATDDIGRGIPRPRRQALSRRHL